MQNIKDIAQMIRQFNSKDKFWNMSYWIMSCAYWINEWQYYYAIIKQITIHFPSNEPSINSEITSHKFKWDLRL